MTTQAQGKSKKKNKEVMKVSLDEFNQFDAPHGHSIVSVSKVTGLDWAATMADHDLTAETQQIVVPIAPRAQRGPNVDIDSLPDTPPFRLSLYNVPMNAEEKDISDRFFQGLDVKRVEISKTSTTVEFNTKQDLYDALCKDGSSIKGKTVNVCPFGQQPQNSYQDRYGGGRGGGSNYGDRYGDRGSGTFGGSRISDRFSDRPGGFSDRGGAFDRDRNRDGGSGFSGYNRSGMGAMGSAFGRGPPRDGPGGMGGSGGMGMGGGGFGNRFQDRGNFRDDAGGAYPSGGEPEREEPNDWRARPPIQPRAPQPRSPPLQYQPHHQHQQHQHQSPPSRLPPDGPSGARPKSYARSSKAILSKLLGTE